LLTLCRLSGAIDSTKYLVADLKNFNTSEWKVRYPHFAQVETEERSASPSPRGKLRRTLTFADEPATTTEVVLSTSVNGRHQTCRTVSFAPSSDSSEMSDEPASLTEEPAELDETPAQEDFSILSLNLNMGATRHSQALISQLERSSISALLDNRLTAALSHLSLLHSRIHDSHSRVLVTGDLNAGKSTFVNALLRRDEIMPTDEQPLTTRFVEVVSARENDDEEEIHVATGDKYDAKDESSFKTLPVEQLEQLATDVDVDPSAAPLRVFLKDSDNETNPSILHNGVVDISLIDAPGLNRDSVKTTANFARQEEIDVVVFVVSAANHFTLSAKEFIWQAGHEKAHLFIVVNRYDQIKNKERCRTAVMEQIKELSPETYADAKDLVHFVDSAKVAMGVEGDSADEMDAAFAFLEQSLRSFVLVNRAKSKLGPAQNYLTHLLADVELLASANGIVATQERDAAQQEVERVKPELDRMKRGKDALEDTLVHNEEAATSKAVAATRQALVEALDRVGRGELAPGIPMPVYPGLLGAWDYAHEVRRALLASLDRAVHGCEDDARAITTDAVKTVTNLGDKHLPADVERSKRVFNSSAMFFKHAQAPKGGRRVGQLGLGLAGNAVLAEVSVSDIFDLQHLLFNTDAVPEVGSKSVRDLIPSSVVGEVGSLGAVSLAVGAFSVAGGKTLALRTVFESAVQLSELASNPTVQKWAGPAALVVAASAIAYVVYELPRSIPRNVGRHVRATLRSASADGDVTPFADAEAERVGREVRKVMRLAAWDLRERFRAALDARGEIVRQSEETAKQAARALEWFAEVESRVDEIRAQLGLTL
jgi:mitofusin